MLVKFAVNLFVTWTFVMNKFCILRMSNWLHDARTYYCNKLWTLLNYSKKTNWRRDAFTESRSYGRYLNYSWIDEVLAANNLNLILPSIEQSNVNIFCRLILLVFLLTKYRNWRWTHRLELPSNNQMIP